MDADVVELLPAAKRRLFFCSGGGMGFFWS